MTRRGWALAAGGTRCRGPQRRGHSGLRRAGGNRLFARIGNTVSHGADPESLHWADVHRAVASYTEFWRKAETEPGAELNRRQTRSLGGRFDRTRNDEPQAGPDGPRGRGEGSTHAHQLPANDFSVLLRRGHADARGVDRVFEHSGGNLQVPGRGFAGVPVASRVAAGGE